MDLSQTIAPKSDQLNADDLLSGPRTVTITEVRKGTLEQPVELHLAGHDGRPYKPGKSMRRVLVAAWGADGDVYVGRSMTLYADPTVKFGGQDVGGIRISHLSHIDKRLSLALTVTRGKRAPFVVQPLENTPADQSKVTAALEAISNATDTARLDAIEAHATRIGILDTIREALDTKSAELTA